MLIAEKINATHNLLETLVENTAFLSNIATSNNDIKNHLMVAATGKTHVPLSVVERLTLIGGLVILALTGIIVFLITGHMIGLVGNLH